MGREWEELEQRNQRVQERSHWMMFLGTVAGIAFLAWTHFSGDAGVTSTPDSGPDASVREFPPPAARSDPIGSQPALGSERSRTGRESYVRVFECSVNGQRVVSDRPCGSNAQARTLVVAQPKAGESAHIWPRHSPEQSRGSGNGSRSDVIPKSTSAGSSAAPSNEAACASVDEAIDRLNARMRQGYTSTEGEWLRTQWHALKKRRHDLRCGR